MAGNILKGIINVEIPGVEATTKKAGAAVDGLGDAFKKAGNDAAAAAAKIGQSFSAIPPPINKSTQAFSLLQKQVAAFGGGTRSFASAFVAPLQAIPPSADAAANSLKKIPGASNAATLSMVNLGRVVQDAPFGFLGIANNLNPLLESFQRLKATTGSTGGALKALGSSLTGAGGLGFGLSVVSTLLIVFGDRLFGAKRASEASEDALRAFGETIDDVKGNVSDLADELQFLNSIGSINVKIRGAGDLDDLREQSVAQRQFTLDLESQRDRLNVIREQINKDADLNEKDRVKALDKNASELDAINKQITESENTQRIVYRKIALQKIDDQKETNKKAIEESDRFYNKTISRAKELESFINSSTVRQAQFEVNPFESRAQTLEKALAFIEKATERFNTLKLKTIIPVEFGFKVNENFQQQALPEKEATDSFEQSKKKFEENVKRLAESNPFVLQLKGNLKINTEFENQLKSAFENIKSVIVNGVQDVAATFAEGIGTALSGGNFGQEIISVIGNLIAQLGKAMVAYGVVKSGLDKILKAGIALPGTTAIALGLAAVALGALIRNSFKPKGRAAGGLVEAGRPYLVGEVGRELFVPNVGGRIVPNSQISQGGANFGNPQVQMAGQFVIRGKDLVAIMTQVNSSQRRNT